MIKIGIAGFGKIGKLRAEELKKNKNSKVVWMENFSSSLQNIWIVKSLLDSNRRYRKK